MHSYHCISSLSTQLSTLILNTFSGRLSNILRANRSIVVRVNTIKMMSEHAPSRCLHPDTSSPAVFNPKKVLILTKLTRLEYERRVNNNLTETELEKMLRRRGSDYGHLLDRHVYHNNYLNTVTGELDKYGIEHRVVHRWEYNEESLDWADVVFSAGGDGTFLLAASKVRDKKPVIGINTDPVGSEGYMCLMNKKPVSEFPEALRRLVEGEFSWLSRQRIRITLRGRNAFDEPAEIHNQQLLYPEHRWYDHIKETELDIQQPRWRSKSTRTISVSSPQNDESISSDNDAADKEQVLPLVALNEVYIGESLSSRVSYYELRVDDQPPVKQKSSGLTVCTGTGSTSWYFNINKLTDQCVEELLRIVSDETGVHVPNADNTTISRICRRFNDQLIFSPSDRRMAFTVRDPVYNLTFLPAPPRGFVDRITVKSRCFDAHLVIDGGMSYVFNHGTEATLEMFPDDALRTVVFR